ncbi:hypothetical protein EVAR_52560_1 [Eumeta japonica]|uniref:Uncharacterized protein n=1 Tax=Eumeta variegata TaxID=151549 RepID=A0A4C1ZNN6_EUMVA|nr:hypothetical protein EVAR_52560_1 [Eumeta japonica]
MEHPHGGNNAEAYWKLGWPQIRRIPTNPRPQETGQHVRGRRPGKAECLADSIEQQCSNNTIHDATHSHRIEEEVRENRPRTARRPGPVSVDEIQNISKR